MTWLRVRSGSLRERSTTRRAALGFKPSLVLGLAALVSMAFAPDPLLERPSEGNFAAVQYPLGYVCYRASSPLTIDGRLDDAEWGAAEWTTDFVDIGGDSQPEPRFRTRAKMLWDDEHFYIAAELEEPHLWGTLTKRDSVIFHDNDFEVFIDPDGDNHQYYEIEINALNTVWDLLLVKPYRDGGPAVNGWDIAGLKSAVWLDGTLSDPSDRDRRWTLEMAIPWKALAECAGRTCPPSNGDQWRVNFSRVQWRLEVSEGKYRKVERSKEDNWVWSPQGAIDMHRPEMWGYVQFSTHGPGADVFRRDPDEEVRKALMGVYHAQKARFSKSGTYALKLEDLGEAGNHLFRFKDAEHQRTLDGFVARARGATGALWTVRSDSRLTRSP
ncbi:MAG: carbohydrate-binding family 9-like protein [Fimbriimonadaceae bacterium]|nr:MAG: carbohydrate-binding family 9-like protein [Fimbriimonadaceae bacterium]